MGYGSDSTAMTKELLYEDMKDFIVNHSISEFMELVSDALEQAIIAKQLASPSS